MPITQRYDDHEVQSHLELFIKRKDLRGIHDAVVADLGIVQQASKSTFKLEEDTVSLNWLDFAAHNISHLHWLIHPGFILNDETGKINESQHV